MDPEDTRTLDPSTVGDGTLGNVLSSMWELLDHLLNKRSWRYSNQIEERHEGGEEVGQDCRWWWWWEQ